MNPKRPRCIFYLSKAKTNDILMQIHVFELCRLPDPPPHPPLTRKKILKYTTADFMWSALDWFLMLCVPPSIIYNCESHAWPCEVERITICVGRKSERSQDRSLVHHRAAFIHISPLNMQDFLRKKKNKKLQICVFPESNACMLGERALAELHALLRAVYFIL